MEISLNSFNTFMYVWIGIAIVTFICLFFVKAPFGRHTSNKFGPLMSNTWGWVIMEFPSIFMIIFLYIIGDGHKSPVATVIVSMWVIHYINRTFIFPFRIKNQKKKMPVVIVVAAIFFNLINGGTNGYYFGNFADYDISYFWSISFIVGGTLWITGFTINLWADNKLLNLRKPGETHYVMPKGGLFEYVSSPNLMGEVIEWIGFAIAAGALAPWGFAIWTMANLIPRAKNHRDWSREKFENYPKKRKIIIPGIW